MTVREVIRTIAKQEGISEMEVLWEIQKVIDEAWERAGYLQPILFPEGKPDPVTFIRRIAEMI